MKCKTHDYQNWASEVVRLVRLDACKAGVNADNATHKCLNIARYAYKLIYDH